jgi:hypothetical protein
MSWGDLYLYLYYYAHRELKNKWDKENHIDTFLRNEVTGIISLKERTWDLRGTRQGLEGGRCSLCLGERMLNISSETKRQRERVYSKFLVMNKNVACRIMITSTDLTEITKEGKYLFTSNFRIKLENKIRLQNLRGATGKRIWNQGIVRQKRKN